MKLHLIFVLDIKNTFIFMFSFICYMKSHFECKKLIKRWKTKYDKQFGSDSIVYNNTIIVLKIFFLWKVFFRIFNKKNLLNNESQRLLINARNA